MKTSATVELAEVLLSTGWSPCCWKDRWRFGCQSGLYLQMANGSPFKSGKTAGRAKCARPTLQSPSRLGV